jgi:hypothetical protein
MNIETTPIKDLYDYRINIDTIIIQDKDAQINVYFFFLFEYCCSLYLIKKQSIIIKNLNIIFYITNEDEFSFDNRRNNDEYYNIISNANKNLKIIFENNSYYYKKGKQKNITSTYHEFMTISKLDKYNLFKNI